METLKMWDKTPGMCETEPVLEYYKAADRKSDGVVVIYPGGGYSARAPHEGQGYALYFNSIGIDAFVLQYRVDPHRFPIELLDARRAVRYVRYNAEKFGINPEKVAVMGSSAGGHLAALVSTYRKGIDFENTDETDKQDYLPNLQILAYPVIQMSSLAICHVGSIRNLLGDDNIHLAPEVDPINIADKKTPEAFIWHTSDDAAVNVCNSLRYGEKLRELNIKFELHVFPEGHHGLGLAPDNKHVSQWPGLMKNWLEFKGFYSK